MKNSEIDAEVANAIAQRMANGEPAPASWIIHAVVGAHPDIEGADTDFYTCCAYGHVAARVRAVLRDETANEARDDDPQLLLPGYERLHRRYSVTRNSEQVIVPIERLTIGELRAKANEYLSMATGNQEHADELIRYAARREAATFALETVA